eukprot:1430320-Pleurochrysis_carterae.AAC.1
MRRACDAPTFSASQATGSGVWRAGGESGAATSLSWCTALASASDACRQRALPCASVVNATSPPL